MEAFTKLLLQITMLLKYHVWGCSEIQCRQVLVLLAEPTGAVISCIISFNESKHAGVF